MCRGTTNGEDVYIITIDKIPLKTLENLNRGWIVSHGGIPVDYCIGEEIEQLIMKGIHTLGSCCGHGTMNSNALASSTEYNKLIELDYKPNYFKDGIIIFDLKSGTQI